jgi:hypothetical protein
MACAREVAIYGMTSGLDAHTSPIFGHSTGMNHVGLCGAHDLDVQLLRPRGDDLPRPVCGVPECASYPIVPHARGYACGVRATPVTPYSTRCQDAYASTESSRRLRLGHTTY